MREEPKTCIHLDCKEKPLQHLEFCMFHYKGGIFGNGDSYEQYQIIEQDFIEFINVVPLNDKNHHTVHSPVLRDIILRACVQIEIFFKEWAKLITTNEESDLYKLYFEVNKSGEIKGAKNWNFRDYFIFKEQYMIDRPIHVRNLNEEIKPFKNWKNKKQNPDWWNVYNAIKHDGINSKELANLDIALKSLAALFALHCTNKFSKKYLEDFALTWFTQRFGELRLNISPPTSPVGLKRYLFKDLQSPMDRSIKISKSDFGKIKGKNV